MFGILNDPNKKMTRKAMNRANENLSDAENTLIGSRGEYKDVIKKASQLAGSLRGESGMSVLDRYGDDLNRIENQVAGQTASTNRAITRNTMAGGGDVSGSGGVQMNKAQEVANSALQRAFGQLSQFNEQANQNAGNRADRMLNWGMQGHANLNSIDQNQVNINRGMLNNAEQTEMERRAANRQLGLDVFNTVLDTANPFSSSTPSQ